MGALFAIFCLPYVQAAPQGIHKQMHKVKSKKSNAVSGKKSGQVRKTIKKKEEQRHAQRIKSQMIKTNFLKRPQGSHLETQSWHKQIDHAHKPKQSPDSSLSQSMRVNLSGSDVLSEKEKSCRNESKAEEQEHISPISISQSSNKPNLVNHQSQPEGNDCYIDGIRVNKNEFHSDKFQAMRCTFRSQVFHKMSSYQAQKGFYQQCQRRYIQRLGLPNIGNTCFLNSVIQAIDSAEQLSSQLKLSSSKNYQSEYCMHYLLAQVLNNFKEKVIRHSKARKLWLLIQYIQEIVPEIRFGGQHDATECLRIILENLIEEEPSLKRLFNFEHQEKCRCQQPEEYDSLFMPTKTKCSQCDSETEFKVKTCSQYLIRRLKDEYPDLYLKIVGQGDYQYHYELVSVVSYTGSSRSGHYYSFRKVYDGKWLMISDEDVQFIGKFSPRYTQPMIGVYSRMEVKNEQSSILSS